MLSRVADSLYWMGRYLERAEHMARLLEMTRDLLVDLAEVDPDGAKAQWQATVSTLGVKDTGVEDIVFDPTEPTSLISSIMMARENARQVREVITAEMWEELNQAYWALQEARTQSGGEARIVPTLTQVQTASFLWDGVTDASMRRGEGWLYLKLGKFVERTDRLSRTLGVRLAMRHKGSELLPSSQENVMWLTLLKSAGAMEAYRQANPTKMDARTVLGFLVFDRDFPRAIRYGTRMSLEFAQSLSTLHGSPDDPVGRAFGRMAARLEYGDVDELIARGPSAFLDDLLAEAATASSLLGRKYFLQ
ncbi:MAG TPA: alpha-E domain-containing protein [Polyangiaceae bacterium]|nr:alpha-E domain-containing protein [Polyangiaceae bacterium]